MVKVLIVDDSSLIRMVLSAGLTQHPQIEVIGTAADPYIAREMIQKEKPDVITLDVEMPKMNGLEFLRRLMPNYPIPTIILSSLTRTGSQIAFDAMEAGAVDIVPKPDTTVKLGLGSIMNELCHKILTASVIDVSHWKGKKIAQTKYNPIAATSALSVTTDKIIAIGASTGGTLAIKEVIPLMPLNSPGIIITQHMPPVFTARLAEHVNKLTDLSVREAKEGDVIAPGTVLFSPGGRKHLVVKKISGRYKVFFENPTPDERHVPGVDRLFQSVAKCAGRDAVGVIMTGMGRDGAEGLLAMRKAGAYTIGQNEKTCVVYGMPKVAKQMGAVNLEISLNKISENIVRVLRA